MWNDADQFFHDVLKLPDGRTHELKLRSMVGLTPLFAVETLEPKLLKRLPRFTRRLHLFLSRRPDLAALVSRWEEPGIGERRLLSLLRGHRMKRLLFRMLDADEFLSEYGVRSMSRFHGDNPYVFENDGARIRVGYKPGESRTEMFGGNPNWRGPIWFPMNFLIVEALDRFFTYYGRDFVVECPTGCHGCSSGMRRAVGRRSAETRRCRPIPPSRASCSSTNIQWRYRLRSWRLASDRVDRVGRKPSGPEQAAQLACRTAGQ